MSKERLEGIKKRLSDPFLKLGRMSGKTQLFNDLQWLIEQAERSIDYDNKLISIEDNKQYVSELLEQNKCYQKALELIKLKTLDIKENKDTRPFQIYRIASEALEGEE